MVPNFAFAVDWDFAAMVGSHGHQPTGGISTVRGIGALVPEGADLSSITVT